MGRGEPAEQAGHRRALVDEHAHVALGAGQRQHLGKGGQRSGIVALRCERERPQRPQLDDAARSLFGYRPGVQPLKEPERPVGLLLGEQHPRQHQILALPRIARLVRHS